MPRTTTTSPLPKPAAMLRYYLRQEASADQVGTLALPKPYVTKNARVYVHSRHLLVWAQNTYGKSITKADVQAALRELGLAVRAMPVPGAGRSVGYYTALKPKGVSLRGLPTRDLRAKAKDAA